MLNQEKMNFDVDEIEDRVRNLVSRERYLHILGVMHIGLVLADALNEDKYDTAVAALLHDCAKGMDYETMRAELLRRKLITNEIDWHFPKLWHSILGADMAKTEFGVQNERISYAIYIHSTGSDSMCLLDKILYVSDYCEPLRMRHTINEIVKIAQKEIDEAVGMVTMAKFQYLQKHNKKIHPRAYKTLLKYEELSALKKGGGL